MINNRLLYSIKIYPFLIAIFIWHLHAFAYGAYQKNTIYDARFWSSPDKTRLVLDLAKNIDGKSLYKKQGPYIILHIKRVNFLQKAFLGLKKYKDKRIKKIYMMRGDNRDLYLKIQTNKTLFVKYFQLGPNPRYPHHRLVIDLYDKKPKLLSVQKKPIKKPTQAKDKKIIIIDAGHGGEDPGAIGYYGSREKNITLSIATKLAKKINNLKNYKAYLTRTGDYYVPLARRIYYAQNKNADLFISIHADAVHSRSARGGSVYILSTKGATTPFAKQLEKNENAANQFSAVNDLVQNDKYLKQILWGLARKNRDEESQKLSYHILKHMQKIYPLHKRRTQKAGFIVLKTPAIPSVLIETAFISNPQDEKWLSNNRGQRNIVNAIFSGIKDYYKI